LRWFQSHNGAIAAFAWKRVLFECQLFQSHNGAIAALLQQKVSTALPSFQSHNGAIAAVGHRATERETEKGFNPTMVRLLQLVVNQ